MTDTARTVTPESKVRLAILDPGHFHAALVQKEMYPEVDPRVFVYGPLDAELIDYVRRVSFFNHREEDPTHWRLNIQTSDNPLAEMIESRAGNAMVLAGKNRSKLDRISAAVMAGFNVLADKPWVISSDQLPRLEETLLRAQQTGLVAYDIMTERYEVTSEITRELVNSPTIYGEQEHGTTEHPGIYARSVHNVMKVVSGVPLQRPPWFFDIEEYGEGLADVGTHVADLVQWTAFANEPIDFRKDLKIYRAKHWPLPLTRVQLQRVTGKADFPAPLARYVHGNTLDYFCNNSVFYTIRGVHVHLDITWDWEAQTPGAGDVYEAIFRGSKAAIETRQTAAEQHRPEVYVVPSKPEMRDSVLKAAQQRIAELQTRWPGLDISEMGQDLRVDVPEQFRIGHEAHFAQVTKQFFEYLRLPQSVPRWELPNMLAKYYVSTKGVELGQRGSNHAHESDSRARNAGD